MGDGLHPGQIESSQIENSNQRCEINGGFNQSVQGGVNHSESSGNNGLDEKGNEPRSTGASFAETLDKQNKAIAEATKEIASQIQDEKQTGSSETSSEYEPSEKDRIGTNEPYDTTKTKTQVQITKPVKRSDDKKWSTARPRRCSTDKNKWSSDEKRVIAEIMNVISGFYCKRAPPNIQNEFYDFYSDLCSFEDHSRKSKNSQELVKIMKTDAWKLFINGWFNYNISSVNEKEQVNAVLIDLECLDPDGLLGIRALVPNGNYEMEEPEPDKPTNLKLQAKLDELDDQVPADDEVPELPPAVESINYNEELPLLYLKDEKFVKRMNKKKYLREYFRNYVELDLSAFRKANPFKYVEEVRNQIDMCKDIEAVPRLKQVFNELRLIKLQKKCKMRRYAQALKRIFGSDTFRKISRYVEEVVDAEVEEREIPLPEPSPKPTKIEIELTDNSDNYEDFMSDYKTKHRLPKEFRFKKGNDVVIGKLVVGNESLLNEKLKSNGCQLLYMCEGFEIDDNDNLKPWYDEDETGLYTPVPVMLNALTLLNLAGSRWTHRDLVGISSLLCENRENSAPMPYLDKLNLNKQHTIRLLDTILGDDSLGVPYEPQPIPCYNSTFQIAKVDIRGVVIMDKDYEQLTRAYALLDIPNADHFIFPISMKELRKAAIKRTACKLNLKAFHDHKTDIEAWVTKFCRIGGRQFADVQPDDFLLYAREAIHRKGLNGSEAMEFMAAANFAAVLLEDDPSGESLCMLFNYELIEETKCFIKDEEYDKLSTTLRFIVSPDNFVKIVHGAVFRPVEEKTYFSKHSPFHDHLIKGLDAEEVKRKFNEIPKLDGYVFLQGDVSAFESSQNKVLLRYEEKIAQSYYREDTVAFKIQSVLYDFMCNDKILKNKKWRLLMHDQRLSGFLTTSWGNAIMNFLNICAVCGVDPDKCYLILEGDDFIVYLPKTDADKLVENSMFPLTYEIADSWDQLSFCGYHLNHRNMFAPADRESLLRKFCTYFIGSGISRRKAYSLLYLRALSYQFKYGDIPDMDFLINEINTQYSDIRHLGVLKSEIDRWYRENWWYLENRLKDFKLPKDTTKVPYFADIYHRLIELAEQKGEILNAGSRVDYYNDAVQLSLSRENKGFWSKFARAAVFGPLHLIRRVCGKVKNHYDFKHISGAIDEWTLDCLSSDKIRRFVLGSGLNSLLPSQEYRSHRGKDGYDGSINECDSKLVQHYNDTYKHYQKSMNKALHYDFTSAQFFHFDHRTLDLIQSILDNERDVPSFPRVA